MLLRQFTEEDIPVLPTIANNENVSKFLTVLFPYPYTLEKAEWWVHTGSKANLTRAIEYNGELAGGISLTQGKFDYKKSAEVGYWLGESFWSKGIATKALSEFTEYVFENTENTRLFAPVAHPNVASMKVLEKCNFNLEGIHKKALFKNGNYFDSHYYAKLKT
jgi:[ribosomal protein S5]-alanine N-acetyltransferase